ncbi:MAG: hypothetical protein ACSLFQ_01525 [Thermoanaerobaculia bacterium]
MSLRNLSSSAKETTAELEQMDQAAESVARRVREIDAGRDQRRSEGLQALLDGPATGAVMSMYVDTLRANPNDPALSQIKTFLRQFAKVDQSIFTMLETLAKKAHRLKDRDRSKRGTMLDDATMQDILDEVSGKR